MKKVVLEGFAFVGGAIMYSVGTLGIAHVEVQAGYMQVPQYLGINCDDCRCCSGDMWFDK